MIVTDAGLVERALILLLVLVGNGLTMKLAGMRVLILSQLLTQVAKISHAMALSQWICVHR